MSKHKWLSKAWTISKKRNNKSSVENQKGAITVLKVYGDDALLVLNRTSFNSDSALLALNWRNDKHTIMEVLQELAPKTESCIKLNPKHDFAISVNGKCIVDYGCVHAYFAKAESAFETLIQNADPKRR